MLKQKKQFLGKQNKAYSNQGVSIIMVIIAMSFVGVLVSIVMLAALYNFYMKGVDRKAKDNFYSVETALEEVRAGIQREVSAAFSASYFSILQDYGRADTGRDERFAQMYMEDLYGRLHAQNDCYDVTILRNFIKDEHRRDDYASEAKGAWLDSDPSLDKTIQRYTDGIRMKGLQVSYIDEEGYMSMISTDFLIKIPDLNLGRMGEVPDILNYCLIANERLSVQDVKNVALNGCVYGGRDGIFLNQGSSLEFARADFQRDDIYMNSSIFVSTDGDINVGSSTVPGEGSIGKGPASLKVTKGAGKGVSLWASGINLYGRTGAYPNCDLDGEIYLKDDLTIEGDDNDVKLAGDFCGFGYAEDKASDSSSIVINGTDTKLDISGLNSLELAGNSFISIKNDSGEGMDADADRELNIKTGNSVSSKAEQLAYLIPAEMIGIVRDDVGREDSINSLKKNPIPWDEYVKFKEKVKIDPTRYKEVDYTKGDSIVGEPLSNFGVSSMTAMPQSKATGSRWVYYYFTFNSSYNANRFFQKYFAKNSDYLSSYIKNYVSEFKIKDDSQLNHNIDFYLAGNMVTKNGNSYELQQATDVVADDANAWKTKCIELALRFQVLTHTLQNSAYALSSNQMNRSVFENLIDVDLFRRMIPEGNAGVLFKGNIEESDQEENLAILIRPTADENGKRVFQITDSFLGAPEHQNLHLIVVDGDVEVTATTARSSNGACFEGIIIASGTVTMQSSATISAYANTYNRMANCFLAVGEFPGQPDQDKQHAAVYFFRQGNEVLDWDEVDQDESNTITSSDLIVPENWVKY